MILGSLQLFILFLFSLWQPHTNVFNQYKCPIEIISIYSVLSTIVKQNTEYKSQDMLLCSIQFVQNNPGVFSRQHFDNTDHFPNSSARTEYN